MEEIGKCFRKMMKLRNLEPHLARKFAKMVMNKGFLNVKHDYVSKPIGAWGGPLGESFEMQMQMQCPFVYKVVRAR